MIELKCSNCRADIELDDSREFGFCRYCGTKIYIDVSTTKVDNILRRANPFIEGVESEAEVIALNKFSAIIKFSTGQEANIHVSQLAIKNTSAIRNILTIGDRLIVICQGHDEKGIPIFIEKGANELKKCLQASTSVVEKAEKKISFVEQLQLQEQKRREVEQQMKATQEERTANQMIATIMGSCNYNKKHVIEGYYRTFSDDGYGIVGEFVGKDRIYNTNHKASTTDLLFDSIVDVSNYNIQLLLELLEKKIAELGFSDYTVKVKNILPKLTDIGKVKKKKIKAVYLSLRW